MPTVATGAGGATTDRFCVAVLPPLVATIPVDPAAVPVTRPDAETLTTPVLELDHVMGALVMALPLESRATATACVVCPTWRLATSSVTMIVATVGDGAGEIEV